MIFLFKQWLLKTLLRHTLLSKETAPTLMMTVFQALLLARLNCSWVILNNTRNIEMSFNVLQEHVKDMREKKM